MALISSRSGTCVLRVPNLKEAAQCAARGVDRHIILIPGYVRYGEIDTRPVSPAAQVAVLGSNTTCRPLTRNTSAQGRIT